MNKYSLTTESLPDSVLSAKEIAGEATGSLLSCFRKSHNVICTMSCWLYKSVLFNVEGNYIRTYIPGDKNYWGHIVGCYMSKELGFVLNEIHVFRRF